MEPMEPRSNKKNLFLLKQHAHAEKVTVTAAYLIHILQATVNYLK